MSTEIKNNRKYELRARAESQERTRQRIAEVAAGLHGGAAPAATTVAEIARRAGVSRLTVYKHFPDFEPLFAACQAHFLDTSPLPHFAAALQLAEPQDRVRGVLEALYSWFSITDPMTANVQRDRHAVPELNALLERTTDIRMNELAGELAAGLKARGKRAERLHATLRLALDVFTWRRLRAEGLDDAGAA